MVTLVTWPRQSEAGVDQAAAPLVVHDLVKRIGRHEIIRGIDLRIERGQVLGLLGPNGAGKTTTVSVILGLRVPTSGSVHIFGADPRLRRTRQSVGCTPQLMRFPDQLTPNEVLQYVRASYPEPAPTQGIVERFGLEAFLARRCGGLSGGQQRRLALACAFAGQPRLVVLDEPTTGLDIEARNAVWDAVRDYRADGGAVLLATHNMDEAERLADDVTVMSDGQVITRLSSTSVGTTLRLSVVSFAVSSTEEIVGEPTEELSREPDRVTIRTPHPGQTVRRLVQQGFVLDDLQVRPMSLEEIYTKAVATHSTRQGHR